MWSSSPKTSREESVGSQRMKRGKWQKKEKEMSIYSSVVLWPVKHLPIARAQIPDLSQWDPVSGSSFLLRQARGPLAHLSQLLPVVHPQPLSAGVPYLAGSLHMQGSSFMKTQWWPPSRPPGRQEVSGICCPLSTHCSPNSPPKAAPATQLAPGERKTPASVHRHLQTPGEACHTPLGVLP